MKSVLIYGGTFNPIHRGHLEICRRAAETLHPDKILLMPAASPPHKIAEGLEDGASRIEMCRIAAADIPGVEVCPYEVEKGGRSYTVETLEYLTSANPDTAYYFLMGTDMFLTFRQWVRWEEIGKMAVPVVASRQEDDRSALEQAQKSLWEQNGIKSILLENPVLEMSSTEIRQELRQTGRSDKLTPAVEAYIRREGLYETGIRLQPLRETAEPLESPKRWHHTCCVEKRAAFLAEKFGADVNRACAAAILHDICKNMDHRLLLQKVEDSGIMNGISFRDQPELLHSYAGALWIEEHLGTGLEDIVEAVRYHTTGRAEMSLLEKVIYLADLTSSERNYPDVEYTRQMADESLDAAMGYSARYIIGDLTAHCKPLCPDTVAVYHCYLDSLKQYLAAHPQGKEGTP